MSKENQMESSHPFTKTGLGDAPFRLSHVDAGATACEHCGTRIM